MNCDEVIRELAVPTGDRDPTALAEHIAGCPSCGLWSRRAGQLDRLWDLTRPTEPSTEVWDSLWAHVTASLDTPASAGPVQTYVPILHGLNGTSAQVDGLVPERHNARSSRRWLAIGLVGLAQAAAVLVAVTLTRPFSTKSPPMQADSSVAANPMTVNLEIEEGHLVVIRWDGLSGKVEDRTLDISDGVDDWLLGLNAVEALADLSVAFKE
jgi:hypothetical protein